ncbi:hypothetical protein D3C76_1288680 [compost metagenome]
MRVGAAVIAIGPQHGQPVAQRVAQLQPLLRLAAVGHLIQLVLLAAGPQPGADVFRQHHDRARADQALGTGLLQIGRELAVQALQVLVVAGVEQGFDAQQVATFTGYAMVER